MEDLDTAEVGGEWGVVEEEEGLEEACAAANAEDWPRGRRQCRAKQIEQRYAQ